MNEPELPETTPPEPVVGAPLSGGAERRGGLLKRVLVILIVVVATPVAAALCGVFCCFGAVVGIGLPLQAAGLDLDNLGGEYLIIGGLGFGVLLGVIGMVYLGVLMWREVRDAED